MTIARHTRSEGVDLMLRDLGVVLLVNSPLWQLGTQEQRRGRGCEAESHRRWRIKANYLSMGASLNSSVYAPSATSGQL
jgi:hypothetical protein